jgi:hypothetical protein
MKPIVNLFKILLVLTLTLNFNAIGSSPEDKIKLFDNKVYNPALLGLSDLVIDIEIPSITKELNKRKIFGKIKKVYFKLFWTPESSKIEVFGLPEGFVEIKKNLYMIVSGKIDLIIPKVLSKNLIGYTMTDEILKDGSFNIRAVDKTYKKRISEFDLSFSKDGILKKVKISNAAGAQDSQLNYKKTIKSKGKYILDSAKIINVVNGQKMISDKKIIYKKIKSFILPEKVIVKTYVEMPGPTKKNKKYSREIQHSVIVDNYEINKGLAKKYLRENK